MAKNSLESSAINIRIADPADADLLAELGRTSFCEAFAEQTAPQDMQDYLEKTFAVDEIKREVTCDQTVFLIAEAGASAAGYACLHPANPPDCVKAPNPIQLVRLYLRQDYYGRNVGNTLMEACLEMARTRGFQSVWLSTWELNHRANAFYQKWEFEIVGNAKFKVGDDIQSDYIFARKI